MSFDYTEIIDFLPDATFVIDSRGIVVAWNRAIEKMTGVTASEVVGKGDYIYAIPFYGKQRPILIDMVENKNPQLRKHYDVKVIDKNTLHAVPFVESIRDISDQKQVEETLRQRTNMLEETITALKVLLRESAEAKEELEKKVLANVKELILPFIHDLESTLTEKSQKVYLETIKTNLSEITSSFTKKLSSLYHGLTPREIQIADFIRQGKSNKEMAYLLKISVSAVDFHRRNLRKKLDIKGKKINLRSFLHSHVG